MARSALRFVPYHQLDGRPNVIVDGAPTDGTVLTLSHWPHTPVPAGLGADLSVQMAVAYLDRWDLHGDAELVSNNHFDQDGLTSAYAFVDPDDAATRRDQLVDIGSAGDFATYRDRNSARVSMAIAAFADSERTPLTSRPDGYDEWCGVLYDELLGRLPQLIDHVDHFRDLWGDEDAALEQSERAVASGSVSIEEVPALDLAVVTTRDLADDLGGHRFASQWTHGLHPMAINNATGLFAILTIQGARCELTYRYESWVQHRSRRPRPRVDLAPLADELNALEGSSGRWIGERASGLTPRLYLAADSDRGVAPTHPVDPIEASADSSESSNQNSSESSIDPSEIRRLVEHHLATSPPAWDPYAT